MSAPTLLRTATRSVAALPSASSNSVVARRLASTISVVSHSTSDTALPLSNVEVQWEKLAKEEQVQIFRQLETAQKKDWKSLSLDEKKAAYFIAFGAHGPRTAVAQGTWLKVTASVLAAMAAAGLITAVLHANAAPPPKTLTKEWQEAANELAREAKLNPITGISSEGYKGKGFVVD